MEGDAVEIEMPPVKREPIVAQSPLEHLNLLYKAPDRRRDVDPKLVILALDKTQADTQAEPTSRDNVKDGHILRHPQRVPQRKDHDPGVDAYPMRARCDGATHHKWRWKVCVRLLVVLGDENSVKSGFLGDLRKLNRFAIYALAVLAVGWRLGVHVDAEPHLS
jgi:hypothetical protein